MSVELTLYHTPGAFSPMIPRWRFAQRLSARLVPLALLVGLSASLGGHRPGEALGQQIPAQTGAGKVATAVQPAVIPAATPAPLRLGINLDSPYYASTAWPFRDLIKSAQWWPGTQGGIYDPKGLGYKTDDAGWPLGLDASQQVFVWLGQSIGGDPAGATISRASDLPAGTYTLVADGKGTLQIQAPYDGGGVFVQNYPISGHAEIKVSLERPIFPYIALRLLASDPADHLRNIRFLMPGYDPTEGFVWNDEYISDLKGFSVIRCMGLSLPNKAGAVKHWADRTTPTAPYTCSAETGRGTAPEWYGELARRTGADLWICLQHTVDDDYCTQLGTLLKASLPPSTKVHLEFSNEVWNYTLGSQALDIQTEGINSGRYPGKSPQECLLRDYAWRAKRAHDAFLAGFGDDKRLVRIVASQAANIYTADTSLDEYVNVLGGPPPALAVGGYIGLNFGLPERAAATKAMGVDGLLQGLLSDSQDGIPGMVGQLQANRTIADKYGASLCVYEGGQHLVGLFGAVADQALTYEFVAANRASGMKGVATAQLAAAAPILTGPFCWFSHCGPPSKVGCWGAKEYQRQSTTDAPKWAALVDARNANPVVPGPGPVPPPIPPPPTPINPAVVKTIDLLAAAKAKRQSLSAAQQAVVEAQKAVVDAQATVANAQAAVAAADAAVVTDLTTNGAFVDSGVTPPVVYLADPASPSGYRAVAVRPN
jgi:hypothetical protein